MNTAITRHDAGGKARYPWPKGSVVTARFSECGCYRYELKEIWDEAKPLVLWILMNPSVASEEYSDPTLFKTGKFSRSWGFGGQLIGNVHAYRATDSKKLLLVEDPVGPDNDQAIIGLARSAHMVVMAYGIPPAQLKHRGAYVAGLLRSKHQLSYLKLNQDGSPSHPLYLKDDLTPQKY